MKDTERAHRQRLVESVRHSSEMEGGRSSEEFRQVQEAWTRGEVTLDDLVAEAKRLAGQ